MNPFNSFCNDVRDEYRLPGCCCVCRETRYVPSVFETKKPPSVSGERLFRFVMTYFTKLALNSMVAILRVAAVSSDIEPQFRWHRSTCLVAFVITDVSNNKCKKPPSVAGERLFRFVMTYFTKLALNSTIAVFRVAAVSSEKSFNCEIFTGTSGYLS